MYQSIIVAVITGVFAVIGNVIISRADQKKLDVEEAKREQKINDRLDAIEHKLDVHNGYANKIGQITTDIAVIRTEIKNLQK